jgi:threonine synthase
VEQVSDGEILAAKAVIDAAGVVCSTASAASFAGVRQLRSTGVIRPGDHVIAILTGHILKDSATLAGNNHPIEIEATIRAVAGALPPGVA